MTDRYFKLATVVLTTTKTKTDLETIFVESYVTPYGISDLLLTDNGSQCVENSLTQFEWRYTQD